MPTSVESSLQNRNGESTRAHRAFLLWCMQDSEKRSVRRTAEAVSRNESTLREWKKRWDWVARAEELGELSSLKATQAYRVLYYPEWRLREIVHIETLLETPFSPTAPIAASVSDDVRKAIKKDNVSDAAEEREKRTRRAHVSLIDGALGLIAKRITAGDIRVSLRDIPALLQLRTELTNVQQTGEARNVLAPIESMRVRHAKATGGNIVAAMHADAEEICAILGAIVSSGEVPKNAFENYQEVINEQ